MSYQTVYAHRIDWKNYPDITTPIDEINLNKMDYALYEHDRTLETWDVSKANQSDMLLAVKTIVYNDSNGQLTITFFNGNTTVIDTDIEKIAVNFDYDDDPTSAHYQNLIITLDDGDPTADPPVPPTVKYVDLSALITQYEFTDTSTIHFSIGNDGSISANVIDGSITEAKLQPNFLGDCRTERTLAQAARVGAETAESNAQSSEENAEAWAVGKRGGTDVPSTDPTYENNSKYYAQTVAQQKVEDSEAYANGTRNGQPVPSTDPAYHNNSKYWSEQSASQTLGGLADVDINTSTLANGQVPKYNSTTGKWENGVVDLVSKMNTDGSNAARSVKFNNSSLAIGSSTNANGDYSFAQGNTTVAAGEGCHSEGYKTQAKGEIQEYPKETIPLNIYLFPGLPTSISGSGSTGSRSATSGQSNETVTIRDGYSLYSVSAPYTLSFDIRLTGGNYWQDGTTYLGGQLRGVITIGANYLISSKSGIVKNNSAPSNSYCDVELKIYASINLDSSTNKLYLTVTREYTKFDEYNYFTDYFMGGLSISITVNSSRTSSGYPFIQYYTIQSLTPVTTYRKYAHAEGNQTTASADHSHAEGFKSIASATGAHAEGSGTTASGDYSHAEGYQSQAQAGYSHAEGYKGSTGSDFKHISSSSSSNDLESDKSTMLAVGCYDAQHSNLHTNELLVDNSTNNGFSVDERGNIFAVGAQTLYRGYIDGVLVTTANLHPEITLEDGAMYILYCNGRNKTNGAWRGAISYLIEATYNPLGTGTSTTAQAVPHIATLGTVGTTPVRLSAITEPYVNGVGTTVYHSKLGIGSCTTAFGVRWNLVKVLGSEDDFATN